MVYAYLVGDLMIIIFLGLNSRFHKRPKPKPKERQTETVTYRSQPASIQSTHREAKQTTQEEKKKRHLQIRKFITKYIACAVTQAPPKLRNGGDIEDHP